MAIDLRDAVKECRSQILMDLDASDFRWPDSLMIRSANATIQSMLKKKPILLYKETNAYGSADDFVIVPNALADGGTVEIQIPVKYQEAFIHGMAYQCFNGEADKQTFAARMAFEKQRFDELMAM